MISLNKINVYRRKLMNFLTKNIGKSHNVKNIKPVGNIKIENILICRPNQRLGNLLITTALIDELVTLFPNCKIDIIVKGGLASIVYKNFKNISTIIILPRKPFNQLFKYIKVWLSVKSKKYDLAINAVEGSSSGKLLTQFSNSKYKIFGDFDLENQALLSDRNHMAKNTVYNLHHYMALLGVDLQTRSCPVLTLKLSDLEISHGKKILDSLVDSNKKTICIFTFATGNKCYSKSWWHDLYTPLLVTFPDYNILEILPKENVSQIDFKAPTFYSENIREMGALMANTAIFIGADSGVMHLASASNVTTLGLFSVTPLEKYAPYGNNSRAINTNKESFEAIVKSVQETLNLK